MVLDAAQRGDALVRPIDPASLLRDGAQATLLAFIIMTAKTFREQERTNMCLEKLRLLWRDSLRIFSVHCGGFGCFAIKCFAISGQGSRDQRRAQQRKAASHQPGSGMSANSLCAKYSRPFQIAISRVGTKHYLYFLNPQLVYCVSAAFTNILPILV